jgi:AraC family transcriptional regulator of adaptative response / DNA-3-methyladenine glycosylase II
VIARVRRVFDLSADPTLIGATSARTRRSRPWWPARPGLRAAGAWDGFELAVRAILGQQITVGAARGLAAKLVERLRRADRRASRGRAGPEPRAFPTPAPAGRRGHLRCWACRAPAARRSRALARTVAADPDDLHPARRPRRAPSPALKALPGVGEWTAQYIALRELREPDAFPGADIGLMRAMADETGVRPTPTSCWPAARLAALARLRRATPLGRRPRPQAQTATQEDQDR